MPKIFIIGKDLINRNFDFLKKYGEISKFKSIDRVNISTNEDIALIVVERTQHKESSFRDFSKALSEVPKLIVSPDNSSRGFSPWLRSQQVFPVHNPDEKELLFLADRLISEKALQLESNRLKSDLASARGEIDLFQVIGKILTSNKELDDMLVLIMKEVKRAVDASSWSIFLVDEETGELVLEKTDDKRWKPHKVRLKPGEGVAGWVVKEGIPVVVPDISQDKRSLHKTSKQKYPRASTVMCVPITDKDQTVGVVEFADKTTGTPFTRDDLDLFMRIVDYAAIAIKVASLYQKMAEISVTDDLTKLFNSRYLNRTIEVEIQRCERSRSSVSLIFMDIDYFKNVNDHYGHLVGSKILVEVGQLLLKSLRSIDIVSRYGGDEFVIVLPQTSPDVAARVAERIRKSIEQNVFSKKEGHSIKITASFGVASYPESAKSKDDLLRLADEAMYRVKNYTKNGVYTLI